MIAPGHGDHIRNRKVKGSTYVVVGRDRKYLKVRDIYTGVPSLILRKELDRWQVTWSPKDECLDGPGLEGLLRRGEYLTRLDRPGYWKGSRNEVSA